MTELLVEFSSSAYLTDTQLSRLKRIPGAVEETFLERMLLVFMDLAPGYLLLAEVADDRT